MQMRDDFSCKFKPFDRSLSIMEKNISRFNVGTASPGVRSLLQTHACELFPSNEGKGAVSLQGHKCIFSFDKALPNVP